MRRCCLLLAAVGSIAACSSESIELARLAALPIDVASVNYPALLAARSDGAAISFPISDFGFYSPADAVTSARSTFWAPAGTAVRAPVTGTVRHMMSLAGGDVTLVVDGGGGVVWELVHVSAPTVTAGDRVAAGQAVGVVSGSRVELGLAIGDTQECPFAEAFVDPGARAKVFGDLAGARAKIETLLGDQSYFDQPAWESENCISLAPVDE